MHRMENQNFLRLFGRRFGLQLSFLILGKSFHITYNPQSLNCNLEGKFLKQKQCIGPCLLRIQRAQMKYEKNSAPSNILWVGLPRKVVSGKASSPKVIIFDIRQMRYP